MDFDTTVKLEIYRAIAETARMPAAGEVAAALSAGVEEVGEAFRRLHGKRLLVPEPGDPSRIRMAPPFSGVPTPFLVNAGGQGYYANCVWDALGIPAALGTDAVIEAEDAATGEPMTLEVRNGRPVPRECTIHFAVPAAHWWDDILYT